MTTATMNLAEAFKRLEQSGHSQESIAALIRSAVMRGDGVALYELVEPTPGETRGLSAFTFGSDEAQIPGSPPAPTITFNQLPGEVFTLVAILQEGPRS